MAKSLTIAAIAAALTKRITGKPMTVSEAKIADEYEIGIFSFLPDDVEAEDENYINRINDTEDVPTVSATGINALLEQRGSRYGDFNDHAILTQNLKNQLAKVGFYTNPKFKLIHREAVDMILHKLARIVNGDPDYDDSWVDISGYATLVANHINKEKE